MHTENNVYIVAAARTPIGNFNGTLSQIPASDLGAVVIKSVLKRANIESKDVSEIIFGQVLTAGQGQNPARKASLKAGMPSEVPAFLVNMLCGSGLKSVALGYQAIRSGDARITICGGQENMSLAPHAVHLRQGIRMGSETIVDTMIHDGLTDGMGNKQVGEKAEYLAIKYNITREEQDEFAMKSQRLAEFAQKNFYFEKEIVPVEISDNRKCITKVFEKDEFLKPATTVEILSKLKPCFKENGSVTAGNSSGTNDSAAAVLLMSGEELIKRRSIKPLARIVAWAQAAIEPKEMDVSSVPAVLTVLSKAGWTKDEVDLYEFNEPFASQALAIIKCLNIDPNKINVHGGAIALGYSIGTAGTRNLVTLLYALERTGGKKGITGICLGGGMGIAMAVERV